MKHQGKVYILQLLRLLFKNNLRQDWKRSVFISIPKKGNAKECSNYCTIALVSHASKVMLKILQARLQQYVTHELPDVQAGFRKGRGTRDQIANICWIMEKNQSFRKKTLFLLNDYAKAIDCVDHNKLWKILKEMGILDHLTCLEKPVCRSGSNSQNWAWNNRLVSNWEPERSAYRFSSADCQAP